MVDQKQADDFAKYLGFSEYGAEYKVGSQTVIMTCDGVGTKLYLAEELGKYDTVGIDLVAMCENDLLCMGASADMFMDYYATERFDLEKSKQIIEGIKKGCELANCKLVGGETAQMSGLFGKMSSFDLAGFAVGVRQKVFYVKIL